MDSSVNAANQPTEEIYDEAIDLKAQIADAILGAFMEFLKKELERKLD